MPVSWAPNPNARKGSHNLHSHNNPEEIVGLLSTDGVDLVEMALSFANSNPAKLGVVFTGSLAEGIGSPYSDIDLLVLSDDEGASKGVVPGEVSLHTGNLTETLIYKPPYEIHIALLPHDSLAHVGRELSAALPALEDPEKLGSYPVINYADVKLLHRIRTGIPIFGTELVERWRLELYSEFLPLYLAAFHYVYVLEMVEKLRGLAARSVRNETIWQAHHQWAEQSIATLLASSGVTNLSNRWMFEFFDRVQDPDTRSLMEAIAQSTFASHSDTDLLWAVNNAEEKTQQIREILGRNELIAPIIAETDRRIQYGGGDGT
jgi:hypothetical protein